MKTDFPAAAGSRVLDDAAWVEAHQELTGRIKGRFAQERTAALAGQVMTGMLAELPRTNGWSLGEYLGHTSADRVQYLLARAAWDHEGVGDDLREYVVDHLGADEAVAIIDETGDLKKGTKTVGVARQYTGTAGRIENAQVGVYLVWATAKGGAFIDRRLYLPAAWTNDTARMRQAGVPGDVVFSTKPAQGAAMIADAVAAGHTPRWVTGDEVYGGNPKLRAFLQDHEIGYVMAVKRTEMLTTSAGAFRAVDLALRPKIPYARLSAGKGAHGEREYDWALFHTTPPPGTEGMFALLVRRNIKPDPKTGRRELAFYLVYSPTLVRLGKLVHVAGTRWRIEEGFQTSKELAGLDQHQVRKWDSWHRWTILAMAAHALLTIIAAGQAPPEPGLAPLTRNEIRRLLARVTWAVTHTTEHTLAWSRWRRRHLHTARTSHYKQQNNQQHDT